jgi:A/G-specific adenine glycosylase
VRFFFFHVVSLYIVTMLSKEQMRACQRAVWTYYKKHGRHNLPWRLVRDPYAILVSEMMLQQTQVARVIPYYERFLSVFPTVNTLAQASLGEVLVLWLGLGYNRRAKYLHDMARTVCAGDGRVPTEYTALRALSGVGEYTARAVCVFSHNAPYALLETNIRTVFLAHFFSEQEGGKVPDATLKEIADALLDIEHSREWHYALMDYGAFLKTQGVRTTRSATHVVQKKFRGSSRELRGKVLKLLLDMHATEALLEQKVGRSREEVHACLLTLKKEGLLEKKGRVWRIALGSENKKSPDIFRDMGRRTS